MPIKRPNQLLERAKRLRNVLVDDEPMTFKEEIPPPGSDEALLLGCSCPVIDNFHGQGWFAHGERQFWIAQDCPLHSPENEKEKNE